MKRILLFALVIWSVRIYSQTVWKFQPITSLTMRYTTYVDAVDHNVCWATLGTINNQGQGQANNEVIVTTDGGQTWTKRTLFTASGSFGNISAIDGQTAWATFNGTTASQVGVFKTTNGGQTWTRQSTAFNDPTSFANNVYFWNANEGVAHGDVLDNIQKFEIYWTNDGGNTWNQVTNLPLETEAGTYGWTTVFSASPDGACAFGTNKGKVYVSKDKGKTWIANSTGLSDINGVAVRDSLYIIAYKHNTYPTPNEYKLTTDGGITWQDLNPIGDILQNGIAFAPGKPNFALSCGVTSQSGPVTFSLNSGIAWQAFDLMYNTDLLANDSMWRYALAVDLADSIIGWVGVWGDNDSPFGMLKYNALGFSSNVKELEKEYISFYPNPVKDQLIIEGIVRKTNIEIYDISGKQYLTKTVDRDCKLSLSDLPTGIYVLKLTNDKYHRTEKLVIKH